MNTSLILDFELVLLAAAVVAEADEKAIGVMDNMAASPSITILAEARFVMFMGFFLPSIG
ncbi:hypothetical protein YSY43_12190 [Paenibacillus sp. YSY-4.3]